MTEGISSVSRSGKPPRQAPPELVSKLTSLGIPSDVISQGPDAVKTYADENGITLPEPPKKPDNLFDTDSTDSTTSQSTDTTNSSGSKGIETELLALGVPESIIAQGREAVMEYMRENNIQMPAPPKINYES